MHIKNITQFLDQNYYTLCSRYTHFFNQRDAGEKYHQRQSDILEIRGFFKMLSAIFVD